MLQRCCLRMPLCLCCSPLSIAYHPRAETCWETVLLGLFLSNCQLDRPSLGKSHEFLKEFVAFTPLLLLIG